MSLYKIRVRRDSSSNWSTTNPILDVGEIGFETNTYKLKVGNGIDTWGNLNYVSADAAAHNQAISTITGLQAALDSKAATSHSHTISEVTNLQSALNNKADTTHSHFISDVTNLQSSLDAKANLSHTHAISDVTGLQGALDAKTNAGHTHYYYEVSPPDPYSGVLFNCTGFITATGWFTYDTGNYKLNLDSPTNAYLSLASGSLILKGGNENLISSTGQISIGSGTFININRSSSHVNIAATGVYMSDTLEVSGSITSPFITGSLLGAVEVNCKNSGADTIGKGVPVYLTGTVGGTNILEISIARADTSILMPAIGVTTQVLNPNEIGKLVILGSIKNINTSLFSVGTVLYVGPTGGLTSTRPTSTGHLVQNVGRVGRSSSNNGELFILGAGRTNDIPNSLGLNSLFDVDIIAPSSGNVLSYDGANWLNSTPASSSGSSPGGLNTYVQFNDGGSFGGDAGLTYNKTTDTLTITGDVAVNGGDITTTSATGSLYNNTATIINIGTQTATTTNIGKNDHLSTLSLFGGNLNFYKFSSGGPTLSTITDGSADGMYIQYNGVGGGISIGDPEGVNTGTKIVVSPDLDAIQFYYPGGAYTFPSATGSNGQVLTTDGAGSLSWTAPSAGTKTYEVFTPLHNQPPASNYATIDTRNSIMVLEFDAATDESAVFVGVIPEAASLGSGLKIRIHWMADTATSGTCRWGVQIERMNTDEDSDSFDTAATAGSTTNGTSGIITTTEITITTIDSVAAGGPFRLKVFRDADGTSGTDDMTGDAQLVAVEVRSAS